MSSKQQSGGQPGPSNFVPVAALNMPEDIPTFLQNLRMIIDPNPLTKNYQGRRLFVLWDPENVKVTRDTIDALIDAIHDAFPGIGVDTMSVGNWFETNRQARRRLAELGAQGVCRGIIDTGRKRHEADKVIYRELFHWAARNEPPGVVILLSVDGDMAHGMLKLSLQGFTTMNLAQDDDQQVSRALSNSVVFPGRDLASMLTTHRFTQPVPFMLPHPGGRPMQRPKTLFVHDFHSFPLRINHINAFPLYRDTAAHLMPYSRSWRHPPLRAENVLLFSRSAYFPPRGQRHESMKYVETDNSRVSYQIAAEVYHHACSLEPRNNTILLASNNADLNELYKWLRGQGFTVFWVTQANLEANLVPEPAVIMN